MLTEPDNSPASASLLPFELLAKVFFEVRNAAQEKVEKEEAPGAARRKSYLRWVTVTHVCRAWREIALNCPYLWSTIFVDNDSPVWIKEQLLRSNDMPLVIVADLNDLHSDLTAQMVTTDAEELVLKEIHRIRELRLVADRAKLEHLLCSPAPILTKLVLTFKVSPPAYNHDAPRLMGDSDLPDSLFAGQIPSLSHLTISGVDYFRWDNALFRSLTHFEISHYGVHGESTGMIAAMESMPSLETLTLKLPLLRIHPSLMVPDHTIDFPHLRHIHLQGTPTFCQVILDHLVFPEDTPIVLSVIANTTRLPAFVHALKLKSGIPSFLSVLSIDQPARSKKSPYNREVFRLQGWYGIQAGSIPWCENDLPPRIELQMVVSFGDDAHLQFMNAFLREFASADLHTLRLSGAFVQPIRHWEQWFKCFPNVSTLHAVDLECTTPRSTIAQVLGPVGKGDEVDFLLPKLRSLGIGGFDLSRSMCQMALSYHADAFAKLLGTLRRRRECGMPIKELDLKECSYVGIWAVRRIAKVVPEITIGEYLYNDDEGDASKAEHSNDEEVSEDQRDEGEEVDNSDDDEDEGEKVDENEHDDDDDSEVVG